MTNQLSNMITAHKKVVNILKKLPVSQKVTGTWTKKEVISHLAGWYEEGIDAIPKILKGERPISFKKSVNKFNELSVEKRKNLTVDQSLNEMIDLHKRLLQKLEELEHGRISGYFGTHLGKKPINVQWIIDETVHHDNEHARKLEKLVIDKS